MINGKFGFFDGDWQYIEMETLTLKIFTFHFLANGHDLDEKDMIPKTAKKRMVTNVSLMIHTNIVDKHGFDDTYQS